MRQHIMHKHACTHSTISIKFPRSIHSSKPSEVGFRQFLQRLRILCQHQRNTILTGCSWEIVFQRSMLYLLDKIKLGMCALVNNSWMLAIECADALWQCYLLVILQVKDVYQRSNGGTAMGTLEGQLAWRQRSYQAATLVFTQAVIEFDSTCSTQTHASKYDADSSL